MINEIVFSYRVYQIFSPTAHSCNMRKESM